MRKYIILVIIVALLFGNANNTRELKNLAIVKAIGIDREENGKYHISVDVADTLDKDNASKGIVYEAEGESIQEALRSCVDIAPKRLYLAHLESLIVSENVAKDNLQNVLDFFIRDNEGSNSFHFLISKGSTARDIIQKINEEEVDILNLIKSSQKYRGNCNLETLNDLLKKLLEKGNEICTNTIEIRDEKIAISGMAYFKGWSFQGYLDTEQSIIYNMLNNLTQDVIISVDKEDNLLVCELISTKVRISVDKKRENAIVIDNKVLAEVTQKGKNVILENSQNIAEKEREIEDKINSEINNLIQEIIIKNDVDILGFGNLYYRKGITNGEINLNNIQIIINTDVKIVNQGGVKNN